MTERRLRNNSTQLTWCITKRIRLEFCTVLSYRLWTCRGINCLVLHDAMTRKNIWNSQGKKWFLELEISTEWTEEGWLLILLVLGVSGTRCGLRWSRTLTLIFLFLLCQQDQIPAPPVEAFLVWGVVFGCCIGFQSQALDIWTLVCWAGAKC